jgi:hypothetical protein
MPLPNFGGVIYDECIVIVKLEFRQQLEMEAWCIASTQDPVPKDIAVGSKFS